MWGTYIQEHDLEKKAKIWNNFKYASIESIAI